MYISWNVARLVRVSDFRFYSMLKFCLQRSLWSLQVQNDFIKDRKIDMVQKKDSKIFYCHLCRRELFLYIWVRRKEDNNGQKRRSHCQVRESLKVKESLTNLKIYARLIKLWCLTARNKFAICVLTSNGFFFKALKLKTNSLTCLFLLVQICALRSCRDVRSWCVVVQNCLDELHSTFNKFTFHKKSWATFLYICL